MVEIDEQTAFEFWETLRPYIGKGKDDAALDFVKLVENLGLNVEKMLGLDELDDILDTAIKNVAGVDDEEEEELEELDFE